MARMGREFSLVLLGSGMLTAGSFLWPEEDLAARAAQMGAQQVAGNAARHHPMIFVHTYRAGGPTSPARANISRGGFGGIGHTISGAS